MNKKVKSTDLSVREIYNRIDLDSYIFETEINGKTTTLYDESFHEFIKALIKIEEFVEQVISNDDPIDKGLFRTRFLAKDTNLASLILPEY